MTDREAFHREEYYKKAEAVRDLFSTDHHGNHSYPGKTETSRVAARKVHPVTGKQRKRVYEAIVGAGSIGATDLELQSELDMKGSTERPRRLELVESGHIKLKTMTWGAGRTREGSQVWIKA